MVGLGDELMSTTAMKTVRELALELPAATRVFERFGIEYCCGGKRSLVEACDAANLPLDEVIRSLRSAAGSAYAKPEGGNWSAGPLADLIAYIKNKHHKYTREEIVRLGLLFEK